MDDAAFAHVRASLYKRILERAADVSSSPRAADTSSVLACPMCDAALTRTRIEGVDVDFCGGHGTWFDRDELILVARAISIAKAYGPPKGVVLTEAEREALARSVADRSFGSLVNDGLTADSGILQAFGDALAGVGFDDYDD
jgi:Zn-finger nucleic acid-binding protein